MIIPHVGDFIFIEQIGNARVAGFEQDTGLSGNQFYYWHVIGFA